MSKQSHPIVALLAAANALAAAGRAQELLRGAESFLDDAPATQVDTAAVDARSMGPWGFDTAGMDRAVRPGDDFAEYVAGTWLRNTAIPADRSRYGAFDALRELSDLRVRRLLEEVRRTAATLPAQATREQADDVKLAGLFASYLDQAEVDRKDVAPILPALAATSPAATRS